MALRIQVYGKGLIPRGLGLAPRIAPFPADQLLCATILNTNGLSLKFIHPETGNPVDLTKKNMKRMFELYDGKIYKGTPTATTAPVTPQQKVETKTEPDVSKVTPSPATPQDHTKVETPVEEVKEEENSTTVTEETKTDDTKVEEKSDNGLKPMNRPEENKNNYQNNNKQNYNKNNKH